MRQIDFGWVRLSYDSSGRMPVYDVHLVKYDNSNHVRAGPRQNPEIPPEIPPSVVSGDKTMNTLKSSRITTPTWPH